MRRLVAPVSSRGDEISVDWETNVLVGSVVHYNFLLPILVPAPFQSWELSLSLVPLPFVVGSRRSKRDSTSWGFCFSSFLASAGGVWRC